MVMNTSALAATPANISLGDPVKDTLLGYLAAGVSQRAAAVAAGVSDSYVSQCLDDPQFSDALAIKKAAKLETAVKHDTKIESVEEKALQVVEARLGLVRTPLEAARIFQILNSSKKRANPENGQAEATGVQNVFITVPKAAAVQFQLNAQKQVIEINGRSMATLPSRALPTLTAEQAKIKQQHQERDAQQAQDILAKTKEFTTVIDGVVRVL